MRKFIIATHGGFSKGVKESIEMIVGSRDDIFVIEAYTKDKPLETLVDEIISKKDSSDEFIIFTDIMNGSVNQFFTKYIKRENTLVITGFNMALLLEIILLPEDHNIKDDINIFLEQAKNQMVCMNTVKVNFGEEDENL